MIEIKNTEGECPFCSELFTGDCNDSIARDRLNIFKGSDLFVEVDLFVMDDELEVYIDDSNGDKVLKLTRKINYCPICGRKLVKEEGNG